MLPLIKHIVCATNERNCGLEKIKKLLHIIQLRDAIKSNIQDSSSIYLKTSFPLPMIRTHMELTENRKVNSGFNGDKCFKDGLLNVQVDLGRNS